MFGGPKIWDLGLGVMCSRIVDEGFGLSGSWVRVLSSRVCTRHIGRSKGPYWKLKK